MNLIDRINLYFKLGIHDVKTIIPFSTEEEQFVDMTRVAETFDDVVDICKKILKYIESKSDKEESKSAKISDTIQEGLAAGDQIEVKSSENSETDEETEDGESTDSDSGESDWDSPTYEDDIDDEMTSHTDDAWGKNTKTLVDCSAKEHIYLSPPTIDWSQQIEPVSVFSENMDNNCLL